jgi:hypothetical protein
MPAPHKYKAAQFCTAPLTISTPPLTSKQDNIILSDVFKKIIQLNLSTCSVTLLLGRSQEAQGWRSI